MIYNRIDKFTIFGNKKKRKEKETLHRGPWKFCNQSNRVLRRIGSREGAAGRIPVSSIAGGEGPVGETQEESVGYLGRCSVGVGKAGMGLASRSGVSPTVANSGGAALAG